MATSDEINEKVTKTQITQDFSSPWNMSDLVLKVENEALHVHRCMLSLWSPFFQRMLNGDFREKNADVIALPGKIAEEIREMLRVMYDRRTRITDDNCGYLLRLADEFQIDQLRDECVKYIEKSDKTGLDALKYMNLANRYQLEGIHKTCVDLAKKLPTKMLMESDSFQNLESECKLSITTARLAIVEQRLSDFEALGNQLVSYLYEKAHEEYIDFLRQHGLEETPLSKCEHFDEHRSLNIGAGKKFYVKCKSCRLKVRTVSKFRVTVNEIISTIEKLYEIINVVEN